MLDGSLDDGLDVRLKIAIVFLHLVSLLRDGPASTVRNSQPSQ
jgi:hypothetical protein